MQVKLVSITPDAERIIGYCARVSNPANQDNPDVAKLLGYCIRHGHWSIFEMATLLIEITTSRAIAQQILRHRSFSFQEFSQRYAKVQGMEAIHPRRQDATNRQQSLDDLSLDDQEWYEAAYGDVTELAKQVYDEALDRGVAKESARFLLPLCTTTTLYMHGSMRSWIHYLQLRTALETQLEHREIAQAIRAIFQKQLPIISVALGWA